MITIELMYEKVLEKLDMTKDIDDSELTELIYATLNEFQEEEYFPLRERIRIGRELFNSFRKLNILQELVEDEEITEIMINGVSNIFVEEAGKIFKSDKKFFSKSKLEDVVQQIVSESNRLVNESSPIVDARLKDGSRVNVVLPPVALNGPIVTIRKFREKSISMEELMEWNSISKEVMDFLEKMVKSKYNILISGGTGSGKTTFLNALSEFIPKDERIITIEDNAELKIQGVENLVCLEARNANAEGSGEITIRQLIKTALRMRPTRILVGEVRGAEAIDMLQAMNTGHDGSLSTAHANSAQDMLSRLETMVLMGMEIPLEAVRRQIASGIDIIVHLGRLQDKSRKVLEVVEVVGYEEGEILISSLFSYQRKSIEEGGALGEWVEENEILFREKLLAAGY